jgi:hypothetical protein
MVIFRRPEKYTAKARQSLPTGRPADDDVEGRRSKERSNNDADSALCGLLCRANWLNSF